MCGTKARLAKTITGWNNRKLARTFPRLKRSIVAFSKLAFQRRQVYYDLIWGNVCFFICLFVFRVNTKLKGPLKCFSYLSFTSICLIGVCLFFQFLISPSGLLDSVVRGAICWHRETSQGRCHLFPSKKLWSCFPPKVEVNGIFQKHS